MRCRYTTSYIIRSILLHHTKHTPLYVSPVTWGNRPLLLGSDGNSGVIFFCPYLCRASTLPGSLERWIWQNTVSISVFVNYGNIILSLLSYCQGEGGIFVLKLRLRAEFYFLFRYTAVPYSGIPSSSSPPNHLSIFSSIDIFAG